MRCLYPIRSPLDLFYSYEPAQKCRLPSPPKKKGRLSDWGKKVMKEWTQPKALF